MSANLFFIGHCASFHLDDANGFMSKYITKENWRRKGIGRQVFDMSFKALGKRNVGLTATEDLQSMYASLGFKISTAWFKIYQCPIKHLKINFSERKAHFKGAPELILTKNIRVDRILTYDKKIHTMQGENVLRWYLDFAHVGLAAVNEYGKVLGWGLLYKGSKAYCLMPLYADTEHIAKILMNGLLQMVQAEKDAVVEVICPIENADSQAMFEEFGFLAGGKPSYYRRMFTQCDVPFETKFVFSVLNLDTGLF